MHFYFFYGELHAVICLHAVLLLFLMDWGNRSMTMAVVHWSRKLWRKVWQPACPSGFDFYCIERTFLLQLDLASCLFEKRGKRDDLGVYFGSVVWISEISWLVRVLTESKFKTPSISLAYNFCALLEAQFERVVQCSNLHTLKKWPNIWA